MTTTAARRTVALPGAPAIPGLVARPLDRATDFEPLAGLITIVNRHDGVDWLPAADALRHDWQLNSGMDLDRDVLLVEVGGRLVAFAAEDWRLRGERVFHHLDPMVHPDWRRRGLGRALLAWAEARAADGARAGTMGPTDIPHVLVGWADLEIPDVAPFAAAAGYRVDGFGIMMVRSLEEPIHDAPLPDGLEVRPVRPAEHRAIWDADCEAFQDHRDPATRTEADFERWFTSPEFDPSIWEVAWDGDEVAGSVWNVFYREENELLGLRRGWLEHVSVRRPWRKRGLATALMARSMRRLRDLGMTEAALGADAENLTGAVRVYEALGFRRVRTSAHYLKELAVLEPRA